MLDRDYPEQVCSVARALEVVGERWTLLIVRDLILGRHRFDEILDSVGTTPATLTRRLRGLISAGVVTQRPYQERSTRQGYYLTAKGQDLFEVVLALMRWGDQHYGPAPLALTHADCGQLLHPHVACAHCGHPVQITDINPHTIPAADAAIQ